MRVCMRVYACVVLCVCACVCVCGAVRACVPVCLCANIPARPPHIPPSPRLPPPQEQAAQERLERHEQYAIHVSNIANILLLLAKIIASVTSGSLAIIASTLDSLLDCLSGFILWYTSRSMRRLNPYKYPIGKKRMQPLVSWIHPGRRRSASKVLSRVSAATLCASCHWNS